MNKEETQDNALMYALGALPEDELAEMETELQADHALREQTLEWQRLNEQDALSAPQVEAPFHAYAKLMERLDSEGASQSSAAPAKSRSPLAYIGIWGGWAVAACALLALGLTFFQDGAVVSASSDIVVNEMANPRIVKVGSPSDEESLEDRMIELAGLAEAYWFAREGVPAGQTLAASNTQSAEIETMSGGFTVFDRKFGIGFIAVENLPAESSGKSYHVWAKKGNSTRVVRAGALPIGDESRGLFFFDVSNLPELSSMDQVSFFVTEESGETPTQPKGLVVLSDASTGVKRGARF